MSLIRLHHPARFSALCLAASLALGLATPSAQAQYMARANASTQAANSSATPIAAGATQLRIPIAVSGFNSLRLQAVVPVTGAQISLLDPQGAVVIAPADPRISFMDGATLSPPLPGGIFITPDVANPADGTWTLLATFPPAPGPTVALLSTFAQSPYQVGMVLSAQTYRIGQPVPLGLLALNQGHPILGLHPSLTIKKDGNSVATLVGADSGQAADFDGLAGDGIYSQGYTFTQLGRYQIDGAVNIPVAGGSVQRSATGFVDIVPANFSLGAITSSLTRGANNCVSQLNISLSGTVTQAGTYSTATTLLGPHGSAGPSLLKRSNSTLAAAGPLTATLSFNSAEIRQAFSEGGDFTVDPVDVLAFAGTQPQLEMRKHNAISFAGLPLDQFCAPAIEVANGATVSPVLRSGFIGQLDFSLPLRVSNAGNYQVSFKVIDAQGAEVGQFGLSRSLAAGNNSISATVLADKLQRSDGPYKIESVLIVGGGSTAQASRVPVAASSLSRWQFFPTITGDLNGDGSVSSADRDLLMQSRGQSPLVPGDRRDLNGDGKIDLQDARLLIQRACVAPNCPRN